MKIDKTTFVKLVAKGTIGIILSATIGYTIKLERNIKERIDEHYDAESKTDQDN